MKRADALPRHLRNERGQALPLIALAMVALLALTGFAIDFGRVWVARQQLQQAVDAAALAAGQQLPNSADAYSDAVAYSAGIGDKNSVTGWGVTAGNPSVTFECVNTGAYVSANSLPSCLTDTSDSSSTGSSYNCDPSGQYVTAPLPSGATTCNAVKIQQSVTVKTSLLGLFTKSFTVSESSTASAPTSSVPRPMNLYIILDNTDSMTDTCTNADGSVDTLSGISGTPSKLDCAKAGVRSLLQELDPCDASLSSCGSDVGSTNNVQYPLDEVGMLVFPALTETLTRGGTSPHYTYSLGTTPGPSATALADEVNCNSGESFSVTYPPYQRYTYPSAIPLTAPTADPDDVTGDNFAGYQVVPLSTDYRSSDVPSNTTLNAGTSTAPGSKLVDSVDWGDCPATTVGSGRNATTYPAGSWPGSDIYGLKAIGGQGSYLAGAITEAQHLLTLAPQTRTATDGQIEPAVNAIIVLSDGELNQPTSSKNGVATDGVDPGATGNTGWTSTQPCTDAIDAANAAKAAKTIIFSIAYDSSGDCDPDNYSGDGSYQAQTLMYDISSGDDYYASAVGDLTSVFQEAGTAVAGQARLVDCTQVAPSC
jgi:Flp pilus assembly protein TadG